MIKSLVELAIAIGAIPVNGWAAKVMWGWFVVPLGVRPIGIAHATGLMLLVAVFRKPLPDDTEGKSTLTLALVAMFYPMLTLALGALAHWLAS